MSLTWADFLKELEALRGHESHFQFECRGAFVTFRSKLLEVDRPAAFSVETINLFGVVPNHVTLTFANGVRLNLYMKHVESVTRRFGGVVVSLRGEGTGKNSLSFYPREQRRRFTG